MFALRIGRMGAEPDMGLDGLAALILVVASLVWIKRRLPRLQFSLQSLLMVTLLAAVCFALARHVWS